MRWADGDSEGPIERGPTETGNDFDIRMQEEPDGMLAAEKIVQVLKEKGVCVVQANAPLPLVSSAYEEAESLWEEGEFKPPLRVHDDRSLLEAQLWQQALQDVDKAVWIRESDSKAIQLKNALKLLGRNMADFCAGLGPLLEKEIGVSFDRLGQPLLTCYTGDRQYSVHIDNPHNGDDAGLPDNGMRLSCAYYLNTNWDPESGEQGGLDIFLSDPSVAVAPSAARKQPRLRVAPHADTLILHLADRMAHRVIPTQGIEERWYALQLWGLHGESMQQMSRKLLAMRQPAKAESDDED
ncbi:EGLN2 [Symbiodinium sp. CCMP2592]|nr:EGLN2 [Symbiodinium sp. CCMP2592]